MRRLYEFLKALRRVFTNSRRPKRKRVAIHYLLLV
jgi:rRNA maturation protein Rpf1